MSTNGNSARTPTVAIVGAGMSGIAMGIALKRAGIDTFTVYEKEQDVGGTWRANSYPGLQCDIMSRSYQYSFAKNPDWSRWFSPGPEILRYIEGVADTYGIRPHVVFGTEIVSARFEDERWRIRTESGEESSADFLVAATGFLVRPRYPDIEGVETFSGPVFHSSRWDHSVDLPTSASRSSAPAPPGCRSSARWAEKSVTSCTSCAPPSGSLRSPTRTTRG